MVTLGEMRKMRTNREPERPQLHAPPPPPPSADRPEPEKPETDPKRGVAVVDFYV